MYSTLHLCSNSIEPHRFAIHIHNVLTLSLSPVPYPGYHMICTGNTKVKRGEIIAWKSESGLRNRGKVVFKDTSNMGGTPKSSITLAIEFDVPGPVARIINNDFIGTFVESTLLADLQRFRKIALAERRRARSKGLTTSSERDS